MIDAETMSVEDLAIEAMLHGGKDVLGKELMRWAIGFYSGKNPGPKEKQRATRCMDKIKEAIEAQNSVARDYRNRVGEPRTSRRG